MLVQQTYTGYACYMSILSVVRGVKPSVRLIVVGLIVAAAGVVTILLSTAATPYLAAEPENGTITAPATKSTDSNASGGQAVSFGTASAATLPSQVLDLTNWKITLPIDGKGSVVTSTSTCSAIEVRQPALATYSIDPWFMVTPDGTGVRFRANIEGCTTSGSGYPRSELREMAQNGTVNASWSTTSGTHTMELTEAVTHLPVVKPQTVFAQIHDSSDDVFIARASRKADGRIELDVNHNGTIWGSLLDTNYVLGTKFTLKVVASNGFIDIYYNGVQKVHQPVSTTGNYFKAGNYTQSNIVKGQDQPGAYGEVIIYSLKVTHSPAL